MNSEYAMNLTEGEALRRLPDRYLDVLLSTIKGINRTLEFKSIINESMEAVRLLMNTEASSLMLLDRDSGKLFLSLPTGPVKEEIKGVSIPSDKGIAGWVVQNKRPYVTNDVTSSEHFWKDLSKTFKTKNLICVPLINRENEVIGVLQALNRRKNEKFTPHDIPVFQALASHVTFAIERAQEIDQLQNQLKEKDAMITEIHHRIKNNLQVLSSLVEREAFEIEDDRTKQVLTDILMRVRSMAKLHEMLSRKEITDQIELGTYIEQLTEKIEQMMDTMQVNASIRLKTNPILLESERALLCGLILNELLLNIYKHAFTGKAEKGEIVIELTEDSEQIYLNVSDNGIGLPENFDYEDKKSLGLWIVDMMLRKLKGELSIESEAGTRFSIKIPKD
jgi:two-component sensor histidine kinase/putative methionine-R-sulfoxide reductase with GAF domain